MTSRLGSGLTAARGRAARRFTGGFLSVVIVMVLAACASGTASPQKGSAIPQKEGSTPAVRTDTSSAAAPASGATPAMLPASALVHPAGKFFGIEADGSPDSLSPVAGVAASVGREPNVIGQYVAWDAHFDRAAAAKTVGYGALYYMIWEPFDTSVRSIASGASDSYIRHFAKEVRAFGVPMAISFGHEMNGNWYPWGTTGATAADFAAAWRHIHDLFAAAGVENVIWVWNPNIINPMPDVALKPYWPGSAYVDWVGITGYFATTGAHTFNGVYGPTMAEVRKFTGKPFIIAETSVESGPDEAQRVHSLIGGVEANSDVLGFIWFNYIKNGVDWTLDQRPVVRAAAAGDLSRMHLASLRG